MKSIDCNDQKMPGTQTVLFSQADLVPISAGKEVHAGGLRERKGLGKQSGLEGHGDPNLRALLNGLSVDLGRDGHQ
jgi:hypothetical protein